MIPILYSDTATIFTTNGIGRLVDAISCKITEQRNGAFTLEMVYPTSGAFYNQLVKSNIIVAKPNQLQNRQAFRIVNISKPINQKVTILANHISYDLNYIPVDVFEATGINAALQGLIDNSLETNPFTFTTDIVNTTSLFQVTKPKSVRASLGGTEGSILSTFSGSAGLEFLWDNYTVYAYLHRGTNSGVQLRYGKNLLDFVHQESIEETITGVLPFWSNADDNYVVTGDIQYSPYLNNYPYHRTVTLDCSDKFENAPTRAELNQYAYDYVSEQGLPKVNISLSFADLSRTDEYSNMPFEQINLCDTVSVYYDEIGISTTAKVIETVYDCIAEKYLSIKIGDAKSTIASTLVTTIEEIKNTSNQMASVNIRINQSEGTLDVIAQKVENNEQKLVHMNMDAASQQFKISNEESSQPASYLGLKGDGARLYVDNELIAEFTSLRTENHKGLGVQDWAIEQGQNGNSLLIYRKG